MAINEAIEIAKILGAERTGGFVNGVLDAVRKGDFDLEKGVESVVDSSESSVDLDSTNRAKSKNIKKGTNQKRFTKKGANRPKPVIARKSAGLTKQSKNKKESSY